MEKEGYSWEPYEVETEDGWTLTLFRITGHADSSGEATHREHMHAAPVLVTHGLS